MNPMPVTAPASAFGAADFESSPMTAAPSPIRENVRLPGGGTPQRTLETQHERQPESDDQPQHTLSLTDHSLTWGLPPGAAECVPRGAR